VILQAERIANGLRIRLADGRVFVQPDDELDYIDEHGITPGGDVNRYTWPFREQAGSRWIRAMGRASFIVPASIWMRKTAPLWEDFLEIPALGIAMQVPEAIAALVERRHSRKDVQSIALREALEDEAPEKCSLFDLSAIAWAPDGREIYGAILWSRQIMSFCTTQGYFVLDLSDSVALVGPIEALKTNILAAELQYISTRAAA
jgi:hypothetical protein